MKKDYEEIKINSEYKKGNVERDEEIHNKKENGEI